MGNRLIKAAIFEHVTDTDYLGHVITSTLRWGGAGKRGDMSQDLEQDVSPREGQDLVYYVRYRNELTAI